MRGTLAIALFLTVTAFALASDQQEESCPLEIIQTPGQHTVRTPLPEGGNRIDVGGGVEATCGTKWLRADSASYFSERGVLYLIGNFRYTDEGRQLDADRATYYEREGWVHCEGNVRLTDQEGRSTLSGPALDYYPASQVVPMDRMFAPDRPHLTFYADDPTGSEATPFDVDADRMHIYGDSLIATAGNVVAIRGTMTANSDSMDLDMGRDALWLLGGPPVVNASNMVLEGDSILVQMEQRQVREIHAWPNGFAHGSDMQLSAPALRLFVEGNEVSRAVASAGDPERTGAVDSAGRDPWAMSRSQHYALVADSIDIRRPAGRIELVVAVDRARATTLLPITAGESLLGNDWLEGDTVTGYFTAADSGVLEGQEAQLSRLVAAGVTAGDARALYHLRDEGGEGDVTGHPAANYVIGRVITLFLQEGDVKEAQVVGPSTGVYLEPLPPRPDTTIAIPDSLFDAVDDTGSVSPVEVTAG
ncbi:MAG: hypothetical protein AMS21_11760 [Gemmatimonas sp. SG8_38_2]|nr:MAG: hypothetical protein AMS21_11760 [Gemmatimonas sp. SG8_38_2]